MALCCFLWYIYDYYSPTHKLSLAIKHLLAVKRLFSCCLLLEAPTLNNQLLW